MQLHPCTEYLCTSCVALIVQVENNLYNSRGKKLNLTIKIIFSFLSPQVWLLRGLLYCMECL